MFPHTVTVLNCVESNNTVSINQCVVSDVFFYSEKIIAKESKGENYSNTYSCIFSNIALKKYLKPSEYDDSSDTFTLLENKTIIIKGEADISNLDELKELNDWFYVKTISDDSDYGEEDLRNIEVTN